MKGSVSVLKIRCLTGKAKHRIFVLWQIYNVQPI